MIKRYIHPESVIYSDGWKGYCQLNDHFFQHGTVNHSVTFKDTITGIHTNTIEGNWAGIKKDIPFRSRSEKYITLFLIRFMLQRNSDDDPLVTLLNFLF